MKTKIYWSIIALLCVIMVACTQSDGLMPEKTKGVRSTLTLHRVSPEQAKKKLAEFRSHLPKNKPGAKYSDDSNPDEGGETGEVTVTPLTVEIQEANNEGIPVAKTVEYAYVLNYPNNGGFAIMSAVEELPDVLGYFEYGNYIPDAFAAESPNNHCSFRTYLALLTNYVQAKLSADDDNPEGGGASNDTTAWQTEDKIAGSGIPVNWGQRYPYNAKCPKINGETCPTGCVATAGAQVLAYHRHNIIDLDYDWNVLTAQSTISDTLLIAGKQVATLMRHIGDILDMNYGLGGSSSSISKLAEVFMIFGYQYFGYYSDYEFNRVKQELDMDYPVIMRGRQKNKSTGHAWVVDGYVSFSRTCYVNGVAHPERKTYLHCNWGWSGESNGYCLDSVLLPKPGSENPPENPGGNLTIDDGYSWEVKTLTYIRPRSNG